MRNVETSYLECTLFNETVSNDIRSNYLPTIILRNQESAVQAKIDRWSHAFEFTFILK